MHDVSRVDRAELDADRTQLTSLPADAPCALPVGRVRRYLEALAVVVPTLDEPPESRPVAASWDAAFRQAEAHKSVDIKLPSLGPAPEPLLAPASRSQPWSFRRLVRWPSRSTVGVIVVGAVILVTTSALGHDLPQKIGEAVIFALVGARAMGTVITRQLRKRGPAEELDEATWSEPGVLVGFVLISGTYAAATAATYAGCRWAGIDVSRTGALLVGLLVTLSLALEYGVVSAERLSPMK